MFPYIFRTGFFELRVYSLMLMIAIIISLWFCSKRAKSLGMDAKLFENTMIFTFLGGIIGARIYYVIFNWDYFKFNQREIIAVWHGGLAIHGGIILGIIVAILYCRSKQLSVIKFMDIIAPFVILSQGIGRFGNFANGEAHGVPTVTPPGIIFRMKPVFTDFWNTALAQEGVLNAPSALTAFFHKIAAAPVSVLFQGKEFVLREYVPWGISFPAKHNSLAYQEFGSMPVHPTFFYEMILNFICAAVLIKLWKKDSNIGTGKIAAIYMVMYACVRAFVTFFRADDLMIGVIRAPHVASIALICCAAAWYLFSRHTNKNLPSKSKGE